MVTDIETDELIILWVHAFESPPMMRTVYHSIMHAGIRVFHSKMGDHHYWILDIVRLPAEISGDISVVAKSHVHRSIVGDQSLESLRVDHLVYKMARLCHIV